MAYVPQVAWCQNLSLRDNILFGEEYDEAFYKEVRWQRPCWPVPCSRSGPAAAQPTAAVDRSSANRRPLLPSPALQVVHACALELDFQILAAGDQSKAGLRGINLSGGQRQRLNLARCAYFSACPGAWRLALHCCLPWRLLLSHLHVPILHLVAAYGEQGR